MTEPILERRAEDKGFWCRMARRATETWDFIDKRDIEKYVLIVWIFWFTSSILFDLIAFAEKHMDKSGMELAAVIGAITLPWSGVVAGAVKWFFDARTGP